MRKLENTKKHANLCFAWVSNEKKQKKNKRKSKYTNSHFYERVSSWLLKFNLDALTIVA